MNPETRHPVLERLLALALVLTLAALFAPTGLVLDRGRVLKGLVGTYQNRTDPNNAASPFSCSVPKVGWPKIGQHGPRSNDPVDLARGWDDYTPDPDLTVYNPYGLSVAYQREFSGAQASWGYGSTGLSAGWVDNYDYALVVNTNDGPTWKQVYLLFPNGAYDTLTPQTQPPTGTHMPVTLRFIGTNVPYTAVGSGNTDAPNVWTSFTITFKDGTQWSFTPTPTPTNSTVLLPASITPLVGRNINLSRGGSYPFEIDHIKAGTSGAPDLLDLAYNSSFTQLTSATDARNLARTVTYTFPSTLTQVSQVGSTALRFSYGYDTSVTPFPGQPFLNAITVPSPTGLGTSTASINYNETTGQVQSLQDAVGNYLTFDYNHNGMGNTQVSIETPSHGVVESWTQKIDSMMTKRNAGTIDLYGNSTSITYDDADGNPDLPYQITDPSGRVTTFTYDAPGFPNNGFGNLATATVPSAQGGTSTVTYSYNYANPSYPCGEITQVQDSWKNGQGVVTSHSPTNFTYNQAGTNQGLLTSITAPAPWGSGVTAGTVSTSFSYTPLHQILSVTEPGSTVSGGSPTTVTTSYNYGTPEQFGEPASATITGSGGSASQTESYGYDNQGNLNSYTDGANDITTFAYNAANQLIQVLYPITGQPGPDHAQTLLNYQYPDGPLQNVKLLDETGNLTPYREVDYTRGVEGELLTATRYDPQQGLGFGSETVSYGYDPAGHVTALTNGNNQTSYFYYDCDGRLYIEHYPLYNSMSIGDKIQYSFYPDSQVHQITDGNGVTATLNYDPTNNSGLLTSVQYSSQPTSNMTLSYDGFNRLASQQNGTATDNYTLDGEGFLESETTSYVGGPQNQTLSYTYGPDGSRQTMTIPVYNTPYRYYYDAIGRPTSLSNPYNEATSWDYWHNGWLDHQYLANYANTQYIFNPRGFLLDQYDYQSGTTSLTSYDNRVHDAVGNVTSESVVSSFHGGNLSYSYDGADRLIQENNQRLGLVLNNGYDADGNPTEFENSAPISYNGDDQNTAFGFDGNGNPTSYKGTSLSFDPLDRMIDYGPVSNPTLAASYKADGLRAMKQAAGYSPVYTLYDGDDPIVEMNSQGSISAINTFGPYGLVSHHTGGVTTFYLFDPQGSVAHRLDSNGGNVMNNGNDLYDAWGNSHGLSGVGPYEPFGYGAEEGYTSDWNTGLLLLGHRYYDPGQGRFLNRDPIGYAGGLNLYGYVGDDPVDGSDPSGLDQFDADIALTENARSINRVAREYDIQPLLLAGAIWVENYAGGAPSFHFFKEQGAQIKFLLFGSNSSLGIGSTKVSGRNVPGGNTLAGRRRFLQKFESSPVWQLRLAASKLAHLARRPNRYRGHTASLTEREMAIILTEYNIGERSSPADRARPGEEGELFLYYLSSIKAALRGGCIKR